eukprot:304062-Chlamydomonas_euryale.AAC.5
MDGCVCVCVRAFALSGWQVAVVRVACVCLGGWMGGMWQVAVVRVACVCLGGWMGGKWQVAVVRVACVFLSGWMGGKWQVAVARAACKCLGGWLDGQLWQEGFFPHGTPLLMFEKDWSVKALAQPCGMCGVVCVGLCALCGLPSQVIEPSVWPPASFPHALGQAEPQPAICAHPAAPSHITHMRMLALGRACMPA